jgi:hypothetical protein
MQVSASRGYLPVCLAALCLLLAACGTNSRITHSYVDPTVNSMDLQGVLVVAVANERESRVEFEDAFTRTLQRKGVEAVASHILIPDQNAEAAVFLAAADKAGVDTILVTRYVGERVDEVYHPGTIYYDVMPAYAGPYGRGPFGAYYGHAYEVAYDQPVWTANRTFTIISDLFAVESREHLWQAVSDTVKSGSDNKLRDDIIRGLVDEMKQQGLLD